MKEYTRYLVDAETGKRFENSSNIPPGSLVKHYHDQRSAGIIISMNQDDDEDTWCNSAQVFWSVHPDPMSAARAALDETYSCLSAHTEDLFDLDSEIYDT